VSCILQDDVRAKSRDCASSVSSCTSDLISVKFCPISNNFNLIFAGNTLKKVEIVTVDEEPHDDDTMISWIRRNNQFITVLNLAIVTFFVLLGLSMVAPILPSYAESFQVSYALVGFVISSFAFTRMILDMPAGLLSRKYDKKKIMILGLFLIVVASIMAGFASNYLMLVIARMIEGAGSALYVTAATVFLAQISGEEKRGQWMSLYSGMLLLGSIFGPTFGGLLASAYDIRAPFFAYAFVAGLGVIPTLTLPKMTNSEHNSKHDEKKSTLHDMWQVLTYPSFVLATFATFALFFMRTGVRSTLVPLFAANNLNLDPSYIGGILTLAGITTAVTMVPMGSLSDKIGRRNPLALCLLMSALIVIWIPSSADLLGLSVNMAIYGAIIGLSGPIAAFVTDVSPQDKLEVSMGLYRMISDVGFIVGPLFLGYLADITATPVPGETHSGFIGLLPFAAASIILVLAGLSLLRARDPIRERITQRRTNTTNSENDHAQIRKGMPKRQSEHT
jgi:DHA1 family multidrug resistance protein-like MFS transporter